MHGCLVDKSRMRNSDVVRCAMLVYTVRSVGGTGGKSDAKNFCITIKQ